VFEDTKKKVQSPRSRSKGTDKILRENGGGEKEIGDPDKHVNRTNHGAQGKKPGRTDRDDDLEGEKRESMAEEIRSQGGCRREKRKRMRNFRGVRVGDARQPQRPARSSEQRGKVAIIKKSKSIAIKKFL